MKRKMSAGVASVTLPIFVQSTASTTGAGLAGLTSGTSGLVCEYRRQGQSTWTAVTLSAGTLGTWASGKIVADGALDGAYELDLPDAVCASGVRWVAVRLRGAANMLPVLIEIELDAVNYQDATRFGLSALPNAAADASGGLYIRGGNGVVLAAAQTCSITGNLSGSVGSVTGAVGSVTSPVTVGTINANVVNASALATDAVTEIVAAITFPTIPTPPTVNEIVTGVLGSTVGVDTLSDLLIDIGAATVGKAAGAGTTTITFAAPGTSTTRLTATVDTSGNRTAVTRAR